VSLAAVGSATPGRYTVQVNQLAQEQSLASTVIATGADLRGRLSIELGSYDGSSPPGFSATAGAIPLTVDITHAGSSLSDLRDAINNANGAVRASLLNDSGGQRLVLTGKETGAEQAFRVSVSDPAGVGPTALAGLAFEGSNTATISQTRQARQANFSVNGVNLSSATNSIDATVQGLRFQLLKAGSTAELTVETDVAAQKKLLEEFTTAYNAVNNQVAADTGYDAAAKRGGPLFGDAGALAVRRLLRDMVGQSSTAPTSLRRLSDLGMDIKRDGTISVNATALATALANTTEITKLFSAAGTGAEDSKGLGVRLKELIDPMLATEGLVDNRSGSLRERLKRNQGDQDRLNARVEATKQRLLKTYQSLDSRVAQLNGLGNYVNQQFSNRG
jgi:flagellar hook-associated protein 2